MGAWRRRQKGESQKAKKPQKQDKAKPEDDEWLVKDQYCKGCKYYKHLARSGAPGMRCCDYTYATGRIRRTPPRECNVKEAGRTPHAWKGK